MSLLDYMQEFERGPCCIASGKERQTQWNEALHRLLHHFQTQIRNPHARGLVEISAPARESLVSLRDDIDRVLMRAG